MTPRDCVLDAIHHHQPERLPYSLGFEGDVEQRLNEYYQGTAWKERLVRFFTGVQAVDTDIKTPLGGGRKRTRMVGIWRTDRLPWHLENPAAGTDLPLMATPSRPQKSSSGRSGSRRLPRSARRTADTFRDRSPGLGPVRAELEPARVRELPWWNASRTRTFSRKSLDRLMNLYLAFVEYTCDLPVDGILFGDDWGDQRGVIIGPKRWRRFLKPRWARIYAAVHRHGKIVMHHSCGSVADIMPDLIEIGDGRAGKRPARSGRDEPLRAEEEVGRQDHFLGLPGQPEHHPLWHPREIKAEIRRLRSEMGQGGGYILAPAKPLQLETPTENAVAIFEAFPVNSQEGRMPGMKTAQPLFGPYGSSAIPFMDRFEENGVNAVWFHMFDPLAFAACERHNIAACVEFKTFRADFAAHPELIPIGVDGRPIRYGELVQGVCLSKTEFLEETEEHLLAGLRDFRPAGIWLDYLTYAGWFETPLQTSRKAVFARTVSLIFVKVRA